MQTPFGVVSRIAFISSRFRSTSKTWAVIDRFRFP
jgi:hypothetical protein